MNEKQESQIVIKCSESDKALLKQAADLLGMGVSTFCRSTSLERAREVVKKSSMVN